MMQRAREIGIGIAVLLIIITLVKVYGMYTRANPRLDHASVTPALGSVEKTISVSGEIVSENELSVSGDIGGILTQVFVTQGESVQKGTLLAKIDDTLQRVAVRQARGVLETAQSQVGSSEALLVQVQAGARSETLKRAEAEVSARSKALMSTRESTLHALNTTHDRLNTSIIHGVDALFRNPTRYNPKLDFTVSDTILRNRIQAQRIDINNIFERHSEVAVSDLSDEDLIAEINMTLQEYRAIKEFYSDILLAIERAVLSSEVEARYVAIVTTARTALTGEVQTLTAQKSALQQATLASEIARASLRELQQGATSEERAVASAVVGVSEASVRTAQAQYESAQATLAKTEVRSPVEGFISDIYKKSGEPLIVGQPLLKLESHSQHARVLVPEVDIAKIAKGTPVTITLTAYKGEEFEGVIDFIYPQKQERFGLPYYEVRVLFVTANRELVLLPGMSLDVLIPYARKTEVLTVPRDAVRYDDEGYYIWRLNTERGHILRPRYIKEYLTVGLVGDESVEIQQAIPPDMEFKMFSNGAAPHFD